jgi:cytochrome c peroxidase
MLRKFALPLSSICVLFLVEGCRYQCGDAECMFSVEEWQMLETLSPLPELVPDPTNRFATDPAAMALGQKLFFYRGYSAAIKVGNDGQNGSLADGPVPDPALDKGKMGCAACHMPESAFIDTRSRPGNVSVGVTYTTRNTPTLLNVAYHKFHGRGGKQDSLWMQAATSFESGTNSAGNRCEYAHQLYELYRDEYDAVFAETPLPTALSTSAPDASRFPAKCKPKSNADAPDGAWEMMAKEDRDAISQILINQGKAIAAYEGQLVSGNSPFDRYMAGDLGIISDAAKRGARLFIGKAACVDCHIGALFTDNDFHNIGVEQLGPNLPEEDDGRYTDVAAVIKAGFNTRSKWRDGEDPGKITDDLVQLESDKGKFRTESLRNVAVTGPYMHTGMLTTLREVVEYYNDGGGKGYYVGEKSPALVPLGLTDSEIDDLVAFLESLTGEPVREELLLDPNQPSE